MTAGKFIIGSLVVCAVTIMFVPISMADSDAHTQCVAKCQFDYKQCLDRGRTYGPCNADLEACNSFCRNVK